MLSGSGDISPQVGVISLGEAGNLGDDLILIAVLGALSRCLPDVRIRFLSHGCRVDVVDDLGGADRHVVRPEFLGLADNRSIFADCDLILFGGGGLLQDSHSAVKPYQWLSYLPDRMHRPPVLAVGHGLGPLSGRWIARLRELGDPFDESWVRDEQSLAFSTSTLGWQAALCSDFVSRRLVEQVRQPNSRLAGKRAGVAVRAWPGLSATAVAEVAEDLARTYLCDQVTLFVLEAKNGAGSDVDFSRAVSAAMRVSSTIEVYDPSRMGAFIADMSDVDVAVAMKLHACVIWDFFGVPTLPIFYAPKVASLFGQRFDGLRIATEVMHADHSLNESVPTADEVITLRAPVLLKNHRSSSLLEFRRHSRLAFQARRTADSVALRLRG